MIVNRSVSSVTLGCKYRRVDTLSQGVGTITVALLNAATIINVLSYIIIFTSSELAHFCINFSVWRNYDCVLSLFNLINELCISNPILRVP